MPYNVPDGSIMEVSLAGRANGQRTLSVLHYLLSSGGVEQDGPALINTANTALNGAATTKLVGAYMAACVGAFELEQVVFQWILPNRFARVVKVPAVTAGTVVGTLAPSVVAFAITKKSEAAGRRGNSTLHMPGAAVEGFDDGNWTVAQKDLYGPLLDRLKESVPIEFGVNLIPVILNRANPAASPVITAAQGNDTIRTMHRRTVGVGE